MTVIKFEHIPIKESNEPMVDLEKYDFILESVYYNWKLSSDRKMFLRQSVSEKLIKIQNNLKKYKFKIWDGYRPREVQKNVYKKYWQELKEKNPDWSDEKLDEEVSIYISYPNDPQRIPNHSTGGAVDLTLINENGKELDMGTSFDFFGKEAAPYYYEENKISDLVKNNRKLLRNAMFEEDFHIYEYEWWHFDYGNQIWAAKFNKSHAIYGEIKM